jgi:hypothetical protein
LPVRGAEAQRAWLRARIADAAPTLAAFISWELEEMLGVRAPLPDLLRRWASAQPARRRLREWARLALHPNPAPLALSVRRAVALARHSTPRALLYAAGMLAYLDLAAAGARVDVRPLLPLAGSSAPRTPAEARRAVTELWRWCIRNN